MTKSIRIKMMDRQELFDGSRYFITKITIISVFDLPSDSIVKLWFETKGEKFYCEMNDAGTRFLLPDGYLTMEFFAQSFPPTAPISKPERPRSSFELENQNRIITSIKNIWEKRVFRIEGDKLAGTCVLIDQRLAVTAAHLGFKLNETYKIKGAENREFSVKCVFICKQFNFAILQSDDFPELDLPIGCLRTGSKYFMMGYPNGFYHGNPSITIGTTEGFMKDFIHQAGTPGPKKGYSGAPVFDDSGKLAGLVLGGTTGLGVDTTIQECPDSSAEQKYARILGITNILFEYKEGNSDNES